MTKGSSPEAILAGFRGVVSDADRVRERACPRSTGEMSLDAIRSLAYRRPGWVVSSWLVLAVVVGWFSPNLTYLAAEGQARMLAGGAESRRAAELVKQCWPDQAYESMVVAELYRPAG